MSASISNALIGLAEHEKFPDFLARFGIRQLSKQRLKNEQAESVEASSERFSQVLAELKASPIAIETDAANEQHYELPAAFFEKVLGSHLKYSSCYFEQGEPLHQAEARALKISCQRAQLADGMSILELGCGWGSLTLWMAEKYPNAEITAVSNSASQKQFIEQRAAKRGLGNITILTCDVNQLELQERKFDRVVSIEMLEHVRNYQSLFANISRWLKDDGKFWCHVFCHRNAMYAFEARSEADWMSRYFFTGGLMPAAQTFLHFQQDLVIEQQWLWSGKHYSETARNWLVNMDASKEELMPLFGEIYGKDAKVWWQRWRLFFMACEELFGYNDGNEWPVAHYLFQKRA